MSESLTDFLLARITEDEAAFEAAVAAEVEYLHSDGMPDATADEIREFWLRPPRHPWWPRVLAECDAKRRIVTTWALLDECPPPMPTEPTRHIAAGYRDVLAMLAEVYADHPDYRDEWRA